MIQELPGLYELATMTASINDIEAEDVPVHDERQSKPEFVRTNSPSSEDGTKCWDETLNRKGEAQNIGFLKLALLSTVNAGTAFGWALQLSLLTPYIQTLGVEHEFSSFVWLCGPIAGLVVQPIVGMWSDQCTSKWGRRRPFIGTGVLLIMLSVTVIGFGADIGSVFGDSHEDCQIFQGKRPRAAGVVIAGFWLLDIANNMVDPPLRALLADLSGPDQRVAANAIYCLWGALGSVLGYSAGSFGHWYEVFPSLISKACCAPCANLKAAFLLAIGLLSICATISMVVGSEAPLVVAVNDEGVHSKPHDESPLLIENPSNDGLTMIPVHLQRNENDPVEESELPGRHHRVVEGRSSSEENAGLCSPFVNLLLGVRKLPKSMTYVLVVMALSWFSWFPFFLFDTDWMGREVYEGDPNGNVTQVNAYQRGVEMGAFGLLLNSVVSGISSLTINFLNQSLGSKNVWALANAILFVAMVCTGVIARSVGAKGSRLAAVALFAVLGFPFAITLTVPYSLTADLTADAGGGQGLAMGILNLAIVIPQTIVTLGAGPLDALFGGGNEPAFGLAALFGLAATGIAVWKLPRTSRHKLYQRPVVLHL